MKAEREALRTWVERSRRSQGLGARCTCPSALARVAALIAAQPSEVVGGSVLAEENEAAPRVKRNGLKENCDNDKRTKR